MEKYIPKCENPQIKNYIRPLKCPNPPPDTTISDERQNILLSLAVFFDSLPKKKLEYDENGIPYAPKLPFRLPLLPPEYFSPTKMKKGASEKFYEKSEN